MLANPQASAINKQQCANAIATCSQAWVKLVRALRLLKNLGLPNKYEGEDCWLTTSAHCLYTAQESNHRAAYCPQYTVHIYTGYVQYHYLQNSIIFNHIPQF